MKSIIGFYVADVVGHGMPAALLTIFLKQALVMRTTVDNTYHIFSPAEVMKNLNKQNGDAETFRLSVRDLLLLPVEYRNA